MDYTRQILMIFLLSLNFALKAKVEINSYHNNNWKSSWSESFYDEIKKDEYKDFLSRDVDVNNLENLNCVNYNQASMEEKKDFWLVFLSSLARAESGLNEKAKSPKMRGHRSYGLFQLAPKTAKTKCNLSNLKEEVLEGNSNLKCALKLLSWQLAGAPEMRKDGTYKLKRPDLENKIFGKGILLWGPLRAKDFKGRKLLYTWFKNHLDQLPFCQSIEESSQG